MDEDKPKRTQPQGQVSEQADSSLVSKIARAYSSLPAEQRGAGALPDGTDAVSNPELDDKFQKLLKQVEVLETYQQCREHKPDPKAIALLERKIKEMQMRDEASAASEAGSAEGARLGFPGSVQCSKCGGNNAASTRFCGQCGAELAKSSSAGDNRAAPATNAAAPRLVSPVERKTESHRGFRVAVLILLFAGVVALVSRQWPWWQHPLLHTGWIARTFNTTPAASPAATTLPAGQPASPPSSAQIPQPAPPAEPASKPFENTRRRPAPPTTVMRRLPGPAPLTSALPETEPLSPPPTETASDPLPTRLSPALAQGGLIFKVDPEYPAVARMARVQGSVMLHATIGKDGIVQKLQVISGNPLLAGPALDAVKKWRYRPYLVDGEAVEVETTVIVNFKGEE